MIRYFLDSSALIKRYVTEVGSNWIISITAPSAGNALIIAQITQIEVMSGISRYVRENLVTANAAQSLHRLLDWQVTHEYLTLDLTTSHVQRAGDLLVKYPLRAYDAVQLATALIAASQITTSQLTPFIFISADKRLLTAASAEGLIVDDPNAHP